MEFAKMKYEPTILKANDKGAFNNTTLSSFGTNSKFGMTTTNGFRSQSSSKKDDFYIFNKLNKKDLFGYDNEKLQETIIGLKKEVNLKSKEINSLRVEMNLLAIEDKKKMKVIENILSSSGKSLDEIESILDNNKNIDKIDLTANSVIKLREIYVINFLKSQVTQLKFIIKEKEDEIKTLRENSKVTKIIQLDNEISSLKNENIQLRENIDKSNFQNEQIKEKYTSMKIELESLHKKYLKLGRELEKMTTQNSKLEEENKTLNNVIKKTDEESNKVKLNMITLKQDLKYKTDYCNFTKNTEEKITKLEKDKENFIKKIDLLNREKVKLAFHNK